MSKKRVHEIAKERGMSSRDVLDKLQAAGLDVSAPASTVDEAAAARALSGNGAGAARPATQPRRATPGTTRATPPAQARPAAPGAARPAAAGQARPTAPGQARPAAPGQARPAASGQPAGAPGAAPGRPAG